MYRATSRSEIPELADDIAEFGGHIDARVPLLRLGAGDCATGGGGSEAWHPAEAVPEATTSVS